jgi:F-type H+-transporting ATPase subunit epsilon
MSTPFECEIITPEETVYSGTVYSLVCPGVVGSFGILAHHAPLIARSKGGKLKITGPEGERFLWIGPGLIETSKNRVVILTKNASQEE